MRARADLRASVSILSPTHQSDDCRVSSGRTVRIGIDLGGTKIEAVALAPDGTELIRRRIPTPRGDYDGSLNAVAGLVREIEEAIGRRGTVGVGIPGVVSRESGLVKNANSTWLIGKPLQADLEEWLGRPVRLMNDANCFVLSEASDGAGAGAEVVFGVILGTGVGGGLVVGGKCHEGANQIAGEWGHNPLPWPRAHELPGPPCYCGRNGCIETFLSGPGFEADHRRRTGEDLSSREIVRQAGAGRRGAIETLRRYEDRLSRGLATVINVLDPDVVVLGGGMSNLPRLDEAAKNGIPHHLFSDTFRTDIRMHAHGDSSGVRGAAWLWPASG